MESPISMAELLENFKKNNSAEKIKYEDAEKLGFKGFNDVWKIETEIQTLGDPLSIQFHVVFPEYFPALLPKFYLSPRDYARLKFIPHVDSNRFICLFDPETISFDSTQPDLLLRECFIEAKRTIERGVKKINVEDFNEEINAYWEQLYSDKDILLACISLIDPFQKPPDNIKFFSIAGFQEFTFVIHLSDADSIKVKEFFSNLNFDVTDFQALYLGEVDDILPPFDLTNISAYNFVQQHFKERVKDFERYINTYRESGLILFSRRVKDNSIFFGWRHQPFGLNKNGFRPGMFKPLDQIRGPLRNLSIIRLKFEVLNVNRLVQRTEVIANTLSKKKISIAGTGSFGSNLLNHLIQSGVQNFTLIDTESLGVENLNRHILGLPFVNMNKARGLKIFFEKYNPFISIDHEEESILKIIYEKPDKINNSDLLVISVGNSNIE